MLVKSFLSGRESKKILANKLSSLAIAQIREKEYINALYLNVLERMPDDQGFNYWENQLESGRENRSELLMGFSESEENKAIFSTETNLF